MYKLAAAVLIFTSVMFSQNDSIEVNIIDNFVTPETPHMFLLSFFTSELVKSKVIIDGKYEYKVSETPVDMHKTQIDVTNLKFAKETVPFAIEMEDSLGHKYTSEQFDFDLPKEVKIESESNFLLLCLFGGTAFLLPSPTYVNMHGEGYFSLTKEIPLVIFRSSGYTYPMGYFSAEYSHIFNAPDKNFMRIGYKHFIELPVLQYISPGVNGFTNFNGFNGVSPEVSVGFFTIFNTFTVYGRYRYNFKPGETGREFHEITLGLYSGAFAIYF